jgi:hypothetical protein
MTPSLPKKAEDGAIIPIPVTGGIEKKKTRTKRAPAAAAETEKKKKKSFYDPYHGAVKSIIRQNDMFINTDAEKRLWKSVDSMVVFLIKNASKKVIGANGNSITAVEMLETIVDFAPADVSNGYCKRLYNDLSEAATTSEDVVINRKIKRSEAMKERINSGNSPLSASKKAK